ncbi:hypothetical protein B0G80_1833 [Paraburkholderia sp. BL6669N2]|nr:hypothetical protein B0G80_1833 [Paraburkholderia sp. BL6669N2]
MFYLGPYYGCDNDSQRYTHFFWRSLQRSIYLSVQNPRMFDPAQHYSFATGRSHTEVTRDELESIAHAMRAARHAFVARGGQLSWASASEHDLRSVLGRTDDFRNQMTEGHKLVQVVLDAVSDGSLVFVPERDELRACVRAIQEDGETRPAFSSQLTESANPYATVQQMMGKPPRAERSEYIVKRCAAVGIQRGYAGRRPGRAGGERWNTSQ